MGLDAMTRKLIQCADEQLFNSHILNQKLYKENNGTIALNNKRFSKRSSTELNAISYFLTFQTKLIEIYNKSMNNDYYNDDADYLNVHLSDLAVLDLSINDELDNNVLRKVNFLQPIMCSEYSSLLSLELTKCNLQDNDLHSLCLEWNKRSSHSSLQILSFAENPGISDKYMHELFECLANFLGNVMCLMLHDTGITNETCTVILNFYKSQFGKKELKNDKITKQINQSYDVDVFKKELEQIRSTHKITKWKHENEEFEQFMFEIADDYGLIHEHYPEKTGNNPHDKEWEDLYQKILSVNNYLFQTDAVIELFERRIESADLAKEQALLQTPYVKKRTRLKQIRLHLNDGIGKEGFDALNEIFRKRYISKKDGEAAILIDGFCDNFDEVTDYNQHLKDYNHAEDEYNDLGVTIKELDIEIKSLSNKLNNKMNGKILSVDVRTALTQTRKKLAKQKEKLINRRFEVNDIITA